MADYMIIASGTSSRHIQSLSEQVLEKLKKNGLKDSRIEGKESSDWKLVDAHDIIVHIFNPEKRKFSLVEDQILIKGIIRYPQKKGYFVPENDGKNGFWFTIKPNEIINFLNLTSNKVINNYYIDALRQGEKLTLPIGVTGKPKLRNQHLSYAVTWYGLALSLLFVYFSYHMSSGRLSFKKNDNNE